MAQRYPAPNSEDITTSYELIRFAFTNPQHVGVGICNSDADAKQVTNIYIPAAP